MKTLTKLNYLRVRQRAGMPYLQSLEDYDIVCVIGQAQELQIDCTAAQVLNCNLGTAVTVRRRLARLIRLGVVQRSRDKKDGRRALLKLSHMTINAYNKLQDIL